MRRFAKSYRIRSNFVLFSVFAATVAVPAGISIAQTATPTIEFINPSSFATAGERGIIVSDAKPDAGPGCCETAAARYRLSAWVANAPPEARVFFAVAQQAVDFEITATESTGSNTWQSQWSIPAEILDGPATLYAYLVVGEEPIAVDEQDVTIMRVQENAQLTYPQPGGAFGTFAALATSLTEGTAATRKNPAGVVDAIYTNTPDMIYVRTFYTTSAPGTEPKWEVCGTEALGTSATPLNGVRCTLADGVDQSAITAVAAVSNDSQDEYEVRFNQSGDAVGIAQPYAQTPTALAFTTAGAQRVNRDANTNRFVCSTREEVRLTDEFGRQITTANLDVHATGPADSVKFHAPLLLSRAGDAPDRGSHSVERAFDCTGPAPPVNAQPDEQGEHQRFGFPDRKHLESLPSGTSDVGTFGFRMFSSSEGQTDYTVWVDEVDDGCLANDDTFTEGELSVTGSIGWGQEAAMTFPQPLEVLIPCTPDAEPTPEPTESPSEEPFDGDRSVSLELRTKRKAVGQPATFAGAIAADHPRCERDQKVVLKTRRPGQRFWKKASTRTGDDGTFEFTTKLRAPRDYRAVAPFDDGCKRAHSPNVRIRKE